MLLVVEARNRIVRLGLEPSPRDAPARKRFEQRQPSAMDEIMNDSGDEHALAGARKPGNPQAQRRLEEIFAKLFDGARRQAGLFGKCSQRG
jgi:hypothetical protein